jgi:hypothetical protein
MFAVGSLSMWFLLVGVGAAAGAFCSGGEDCTTGADESAPYVGLLLVGSATGALIGLVTVRRRLALLGAVGHASGTVLGFAIAFGSAAAPTQSLSILGLLALVVAILAADALGVGAAIRGRQR